MRRISLFILFFSFFISASLNGDYRIPPGNEPPRDRVQEALDRCGQTRRPSPERLDAAKRSYLANLGLRNACAECYSPEQIVKNFCFNNKAKQYVEFKVDFSSPESSLKTAEDLRCQIDDKRRGRRIRKYCIKPINKKRHGKYFDNKVDDYIKQLKPIVEQRRIEQQKKNYQDILQAHRSQALGGDNLAKKKLIDYGEKLIARFDTNSAAREQLGCVVRSLQNDGATRKKRYGVSKKLKMYEYGIDSKEIENFSGNELQRHFHKKIVHSLHCSFRIAPSDVKTLAICSAKCAYAANRANEYSLVSACLDFADSALYMIKRMGSGIEQCKVDVQRALSFLSGNGEFPINPVSFSDIYDRMKNQSLKENAGDVVEVLSRTVANAAVLFVAYMTAGVVIETGAAAIPVITAAQKYSEPFVASITQGGGAVLERAVSSGVSVSQAAAIVIGQAAPVVKCVAEVAKVSYFAAQGGPGGGDANINDLNHIFGQPRHKLEKFLNDFDGNRVEAYNAILRATQKYVERNGITDIFEEVVRVNGASITVRGKVIGGVVKIGTAFIK